ncbi:hypothetical protein CYMTET_21459 [Cymbomonas tetramitiformis]|uniref:Uncharacterized protein n=1 Tax=Cymbomonas tetramitiformis TaxID=36881 RepID=A0AAE0L2V5_9CHLO|nr:hypothetical protein CYMTET_21459 [Cymbomonas tetramitiformis]
MDCAQLADIWTARSWPISGRRVTGRYLDGAQLADIWTARSWLISRSRAAGRYLGAISSQNYDIILDDNTQRGGGGGYHSDKGVAIDGGRGGGLVGGGGEAQQGRGGSQVAGGTAATMAVTGETDCSTVDMRCGVAGVAFKGGHGSEVSPGGGGGYYGGGAGLWYSAYGVGGGGGGSGYKHPDVDNGVLHGGGSGAIPRMPTGKLIHPVGEHERVGHGGMEKGQAGEHGYCVIITLKRELSASGDLDAL